MIQCLGLFRGKALIAHSLNADVIWSKAARELKLFEWDMKESGQYRVEPIVVMTLEEANSQGVRVG